MQKRKHLIAFGSRHEEGILFSAYAVPHEEGTLFSACTVSHRTEDRGRKSGASANVNGLRP